MPKSTKSMSVIRLIGTNAVVFLLLYALVELLYSGYRYLTGGSPDSFSVFEHPGQTIKFDPVRGYYLTRTPSRIARVNFGKIEYQGSYQGNAQGFADRDDFNIKRSSASERRIAVFGDSFAAGIMEPLNSPNWPDRVEDLCKVNGSRPLVLLNFSLDGAGLANWASILRNVVVKDQYDLDGLLFAVAWDDLDRTFAFFDQVDSNRFLHAVAPTWDIAAQPKTRGEALEFLEKDPDPAHRYVLSTEEYDAFLTGNWKPRQWSFRLSELVAGMLRGGPPRRNPRGEFEPGQVALIEQIQQIAKEHSWPIAVVYVPNREELLGSRGDPNIEKCRKFSEILGATFFDGREAFQGLSHQQIKDDWFPIDAHWNRGGSDQFAGFMGPKIQGWLAVSLENRANSSTSGDEWGIASLFRAPKIVAHR
jgi:hypothetical protein